VVNGNAYIEVDLMIRRSLGLAYLDESGRLVSELGGRSGAAL
jgi:hypothetical protein